MACWMVAEESATRSKIRAARDLGIPAVAGGGPFEVAVAQRALTRISGALRRRGHHADRVRRRVHRPAASRRLRSCARRASTAWRSEFELGEKHAGRFTDETGRRADRDRAAAGWRPARCRLVVEARESAQDVGLFSAPGQFDSRQADRYRRGVRARHGAVRGAQQGQPVRADRPFRARGPAGQRPPGGGARGSRSTGADCTPTPFDRANLRPRPPAEEQA